MNLKTILIIVVLLAILGVVFLIDWARKDKLSDETNIITSVIANNQTQGGDAVSKPAVSEDFLVYTLTAENPTKKPVENYVFEVDLSDLTELAILVDAQGGNYNSDNKLLSWSELTIPAEGRVDKQFTVRVKQELPEDSDKVMIVQFNNEIRVRVNNNRLAGRGISTTVSSNPDAATSTGKSEYVAPSVGLPASMSLVFAGLSTLFLALSKRKIRI